jgi:MFS family permease
MIQGIFVGGVGIYTFYALQPYLLELYGDPGAYQIAGLVAAIVACAQILGGVAAPRIRRLFRRRTSALLAAAGASVAALALTGLIENFYVVIGLIVVWALLSAASLPIRQTYINGLIPSTERASILSFDSMMASAGGVGIQPALGRAADVWGYGSSYLVGAGLSGLALPFLLLSRKQNAAADTVEVTDTPAAQAVPEAAPHPTAT